VNVAEEGVSQWKFVAVGGTVVLVVALASVFGPRSNSRVITQTPSSSTAPSSSVRAPHVSYGDVIAGRIETAGAHDVYSFSASPGDVIRVAGDGCDLGTFVIGLIDASGHGSPGPSCRTGSEAHLAAGGTYELVINAVDGGSGGYHFVFKGASSGTK
jgi:hypothetical protein